ATSYADTGRSPSTTYRYSIVAYDAAGNSSSPSPEVPATTQAIVPSSPGGTSASLTASAPAYFSFEDGTSQGWLPASNRLTLSNSSAFSLDGSRSLRIALPGVSPTSPGFLYVWMPSGVTGPTAGKTVPAHLHLPGRVRLQARAV